MDHRTTTWQRVLALGLICVGLGASSCTSPEAYRKAMEERDQEIARLREERAQLKNDRQGLLQQIDDLAAQLREANSTISEHREVIEASSQPELDGLGIDYGYRNGMAVISIPSSITFASGKADLSKDGKEAMRKVAAVLKKNHASGVYSIEGHTDTDPIRKSSFKTNRELSLARATAVLTFLVEDCDIADEQCVVAGYGQYRPVDPGTSAGAKAKNRRVEIVVHAARR